jgi:hypothetical protein
MRKAAVTKSRGANNEPILDYVKGIHVTLGGDAAISRRR